MTHRTLSTAMTFALVACGPPAASSETQASAEQGESGSATDDDDSTSTEDESTEDSTDDNGFGSPESDLPTAPCDSFAQDCPLGEKCVPYASSPVSPWEGYKCVLVEGAQEIGDACSYNGPDIATDDCDEASHCWNLEENEGDWTGVCTPFCLGEPEDPMCPEGYSCAVSSSLAICVLVCDPIVQDCPEGLGCFWANNTFSCVFTSADLPAGEPCEFLNDCAGGLICVPPGLVPGCVDDDCCTGFCDLDDDQGCVDQPGTECTAFFEEGRALPGYDHVGVCVIPE